MDMGVNSPLSCLINALWWLRVPYHACQDLILCVGWHWAGGPVKFPLTIQGSWHELPTRTSKQYHEGKSLKTAIDLSIKFDSPQNSFFHQKLQVPEFGGIQIPMQAVLRYSLCMGFTPASKQNVWWFHDTSEISAPPKSPPHTPRKRKKTPRSSVCSGWTSRFFREQKPNNGMSWTFFEGMLLYYRIQLYVVKMSIGPTPRSNPPLGFRGTFRLSILLDLEGNWDSSA